MKNINVGGLVVHIVGKDEVKGEFPAGYKQLCKCGGMAMAEGQEKVVVIDELVRMLTPMEFVAAVRMAAAREAMESCLELLVATFGQRLVASVIKDMLAVSMSEGQVGAMYQPDEKAFAEQVEQGQVAHMLDIVLTIKQ